MTADLAIDPYAGVIGQREAVDALRAAARSPVHAYLLVGQRSRNARPVARAFAAQLLAAGLDGDAAARATELALAEKHPDLRIVAPDGGRIPLGDPPNPAEGSARWIVREAAKAPVEGDRQVFVLEGLDVLSAPALLKTLEEPNPSTFFVVVLESVAPELVTIASRCVPVQLTPVPTSVIVEALVREGAPVEQAEQAAAAAAGDVDRARVLATDERLALRREAWYRLPSELDGSGHAVWRTVVQVRSLIDEAQRPLDQRHAQEAAALRDELERYGLRMSVLKDLETRQKRERRRFRMDELAFGFATLEARYRDELHAAAWDPAAARRLTAALDLLDAATEPLSRNVVEALYLQALFLKLPRLHG